MPFRWYEKQADGSLLELTLVGVTEYDPANPDQIIVKPLQVSRVGDPIPASTPLPPLITTLTMSIRTSATLVWTAPNNTGRPPITDYNVYRSSNGGPETYIDNVGSASILSFTDTPVPVGTPEIVFTYRVRAVNADGVGAPSSGRLVQWSGIVLQPPTPPTNFTRGQLTSSSVTLTWSVTPDTAVTKYGIYNGDTLLVDNIDKNALSFTWNNLTPGATYSALNLRRFGNGQWSGQSNTIAPFTIPQPTTSKFFGHQPGKMYVGMTIGPQTNSPYNGSEPSWDTMVTDTIQHQVYADRIYQPSYTGKAQTDLGDVPAERRIPWISSKPADISGSLPNSQAGWDSIASGNADAAIRAYFDSLLGVAGLANGPIVWTFHHEPQQVGRTAAIGTSFNNAFNRIIDLAKARPTWNDKIIFCPNYMEFMWRSSDSRQIGGAVQNAWFPSSALQRWDFFSFDMYPFQSTSVSTSPTDYQSVHPIMRIQRMKDSLNLYGYPDMLLGVGEFAGRHNIGGYVWTSAQWARSIMDYMSNDPRFWIACWFNSDGGVADESLMWGLEPGDTETQMAVFREKLSISARLADL